MNANELIKELLQKTDNEYFKLLVVDFKYNKDYQIESHPELKKIIINECNKREMNYELF